MVSEKYANAYTEVLYYLKGIDKKSIERIPKKLIEMFEENANKDYECKFDYNLPLSKLNLSDEALGLIGMIAYNYCCNSPEEKQELEKIFIANEKEYQKQLKEKYNLDNMFKKNKEQTDMQQESQETSNVALVEYKESIFKRIINKIKAFVNKKINKRGKMDGRR